MKTKSIKVSEIEKNWWIADAKNQTLGRLASKIAQILRGKHKVNLRLEKNISRLEISWIT